MLLILFFLKCVPISYFTFSLLNNKYEFITKPHIQNQRIIALPLHTTGPLIANLLKGCCIWFLTDVFIILILIIMADTINNNKMAVSLIFEELRGLVLVVGNCNEWKLLKIISHISSGTTNKGQIIFTLNNTNG